MGNETKLRPITHQELEHGCVPIACNRRLESSRFSKTVSIDSVHSSLCYDFVPDMVWWDHFRGFTKSINIEVARLHFEESLTLEEVADKLGKRSSTVSYMLRSFIRDIRIKWGLTLTDLYSPSGSTTHGFVKSGKFDSEYSTWRGIHQRCYNPHERNYCDYGGRGITVCERWESFDYFLADVGSRPHPNMSLDRINVNGNYEPSNVRWATPLIQSLNRRPLSKEKLIAIGKAGAKGFITKTTAEQRHAWGKKAGAAAAAKWWSRTDEERQAIKDQIQLTKQENRKARQQSSSSSNTEN